MKASVNSPMQLNKSTVTRLHMGAPGQVKHRKVAHSITTLTSRGI